MTDSVNNIQEPYNKYSQIEIHLTIQLYLNFLVFKTF